MTIYRHRDKWRFDFWKSGVRHRESGYKTKQEAKDAESDARKKIGKMNSDFIDLCDKRLKELKLKRSDKFFKENEKFIKNLILIWGNKKEITRKDVEEFLNERAKHSPFVANKELRFIKALFNHGVNREWFTYNPAGKVGFFPVDKKRKYIPPREDVEAVLKVVNDEQRDYLLTIIGTLGRVNEINKLEWSDIYDDYLVLETRKAKNSNLKERNIPLNKTLKRVFKKRKEGFVFTRRGKPYGYRSKFLKNACKKAKVKVFTYHNLRHYGASLLADAGVPLTTIQYLLGHEKVTTTDIYLQAISATAKSAVEALTHKIPHNKKRGLERPRK